MGDPNPSNTVEEAVEMEKPDKFNLRQKDRDAIKEILDEVDSLDIKDMLNALQRGEMEVFKKIAFYFLYKQIKTPKVKAKVKKPEEKK